MTQQTYERIVMAFREAGHNYSDVARIVGRDRVCYETVMKAWGEGWPKRGWKAVKDVFLEEQLEARAKEREADRAAQEERIRRGQQEREEARRSAVEARAEEGAMVRRARRTSVMALHVSTQLLAGAAELSGVVKRQLEELAQKSTAELPSPRETVGLLKRVVEIDEAIKRSAHEAMVMERLHLGEPTDIVKHVDDADGEMTMAEAEVRIEAARQALEESRRARLTVVSGGAGEDATAGEGKGEEAAG